ncbi:MAG: GntR family transcriptional regulator [Eubacteriales bacterium]|nr:GntR family transcriptional regulator [Eubacteriales bacterium]
MKLDRYSSIPLYAQLREVILERIQEGVYAAGEKIPSEMDFCKELDLSRPTVRQAVAELVADGVLEIRKGKGTFVAGEADRMIVPRFTALSFSFLNLNSYEQIDLKPIKLLESDKELDAIFQVPENQSHPGYWQAEWPMPYDDQLVGICQSFVPVQLFPDLGQAIAAGKRMVDIKSNKYAYLPQRGSLKLVARPARNKEASLLDLPRRSIILAMEGPLFARSGHVCEVLRIIMRPDLIGVEIN